MRKGIVIGVLVLLVIAIIAGIQTGVLTTDPTSKDITYHPDRAREIAKSVPRVRVDREPSRLVDLGPADRPVPKAPKKDCTTVTVERPDIDPASPYIWIRFRSEVGKGEVAGIADCLDGAENVLETQADPNGGIKVRLVTQDGKAALPLPTSYTRGTADQVVCLRGEEPHRKYAISWSGTLPSAFKLERIPVYDREKADAACKALAARA